MREIVARFFVAHRKKERIIKQEEALTTKIERLLSMQRVKRK